jgi:hypothetical protein
MNTADKSLSLVDYALRRRFTFFDLKPEFSTEKFKKYLETRGANRQFIERLVSRIDGLNREIAADTKHLGSGFVIGHSYFCRLLDEKVPDENWFNEIIKHDISPLLREYWFDDDERSREEIGKLVA